MLMDKANLLVVTAEKTAQADRASPLERDVAIMFDQWRAPLLAYLLTFRLPVDDSEEIVQEVFLALFLHLRRGRPRENLRGWIFRVGHNLALKRRSALGRQLLCRSAMGTLEDVPDLAPDPEHSLTMKQRQSRLLSVVAALPEQDRCCIHLRAAGLRYREIGEILGISLGSVSLSLGRALGRLMQADRR